MVTIIDDQCSCTGCCTVSKPAEISMVANKKISNATACVDWIELIKLNVFDLFSQYLLIASKPVFIYRQFKTHRGLLFCLLCPPKYIWQNHLQVYKCDIWGSGLLYRFPLL